MADLLRTTGHNRSLLVTLLLALYIATLSGAPVQENVKYDFSEICPGIRLKHGNRVLNKRDVTFTEADLASPEPYLHNQPLADRMDVWCKTAQRQSQVAERIGESKWSETDISNVDIVEGDMILTKDTIHQFTGHKERPGQARPKRQMKAEQQWPNGQIPYRFNESSSFTEARKTIIREQLDKYEELTCLRFTKTSADTKTSHLIFTSGKPGCFSTVGRAPTPQGVNLGHFSCFWPGKILHEVGHAIGFTHQHNRPDRDRYVTIDASAVKEGNMGNFNMGTWKKYRTYGVPYDYTSVMHYNRGAFSTGSKFTIRPKDKLMDLAMGLEDALSFYDTKIINLQYCSDKCPHGIEWDNCKRGGYRNPNKCGECLCQVGFASPFCEEIVAHGGENHAACELPQTLEAGLVVKWISSPAYGSPGYPASVTCTWMIKAPPRKVVKATFVDQFKIVSSEPCWFYVELRYKNMALPGPRFCGENPPQIQDPFISEGREMLVRFHIGNGNANYPGFKLKYQAIGCGGCSYSGLPPAKRPWIERGCYDTKLYSCDESEPERKNTCFDIEPEPYCCDDYIQSETICGKPGPIPWGH